MLSKLHDLYETAWYWFVRNIWHFVRYDFHQGVGNLVRWFPIIWRDRDWDQHYLLRLMEKKMGQMSHLQTNYGNGLYRDRYARQLLVASRICKRLGEDVYDDIAEKRYPRPEGWTMIFEDDRISFTPDPLGKFRRELSRTLRERDKEMLGELISKYIDHWWD